MISDRMDRRRLLLIVAVLGAVATVAIPFVAGSFWLLALALAAFGSVAAGLYTVGLAHLGARLTGSDLASANAAFIFMYSVGMLAGPASMGWGMEVWNPHASSWSPPAISPPTRSSPRAASRGFAIPDAGVS